LEKIMARSDDAAASPNQLLLDEVNAAGTWFRAKKTRPIWAKKVGRTLTVETLEGTEKVEPGDFLCKGAADELWPQAAASLEKKYDPTDDVKDEGWRKYTPKPDAKGVVAACIDHAFDVAAEWGRLSGKAGDYLVKNYEDREVAYPSDVWIVDQTLFAATYERVAEQH
jgi:hypothetical protein